MFFFAVVLLVAFITSFLIVSNKIDDAYTKTYIFDTKGQAYMVNTVEAGQMRMFEYEAHVKTFFMKWYSFDENTYETNIAEALELISDQGKELLNEYTDLDMLNTLIQKNIRYGVSITDIGIDMSTIPISGFIEGIQTGYRARGSLSRGIRATFTLYDVSRSRKNIQGCKINDWKVTYYETKNQ